MNTAELNAALRTRYCSPEWALFFEVGTSTGGSATYTDAVAMNLYRSRGMEINGFEVKASRSDWQRELKRPQKAEAMFNYCDRWWLVAGDKDIVKMGELPPTWGLIVANGSGLKVAVQAPKLEARPIERGLLAMLCRRASTPGDGELEAIIRPRIEVAVTQATSYRTQEIGRLEREVAELKKGIKEFEQASGITVSTKNWNWSYTPEQTAKAVKFILEGGIETLNEEFGDIEKRVTKMLTTVQELRSITKQGDIND